MRVAKRILAIVLAIVTVWTGIPFGTVKAGYDGETAPQVTEMVQGEVVMQVEGQGMQEPLKTQQTLLEQFPPEESIPLEQKQIPFEANAPLEPEQKTGVQPISADYLVAESSYISAPGTQRIVVGVGEDGDVVETASLTYFNEETQERFTVLMERVEGGAVLFSMDFVEGQVGIYSLEGLEYTLNGVLHSGNLDEIGIETRFGVGKEVETAPDAVIVDQEEITAEIVTVDEDGQVSSQNNISEAIDEAQSKIGRFEKRASGNVVVVLDPGHDNTHAGAQHNGLSEEKLNLQIAKYCRETLEQYAGVTVYLTRSENGSCPYPGTSSLEDLSGRVAFAKSVGAHVYVSLHLNAFTNSQPNGSEVYYPNSNYNPAVGEEGGQLADKILEKLGALGLNIRGKQIHNASEVTYPDGSVADVYRVIRDGKLVGIPAIIVEHAFMTNAGDVNRFLTSEEGLRRLAVADAEGIAAHFGLQKKNALQINGIFYTEKDDGIEAGVDWSSTSASVQFRWLVYDTARGIWTTVSDWGNADYITWRPQEGNYWLRVEARTAEEAEANWTVVYESKRDYTHHYVNISGIYAEEGSSGIRAGAVHMKNDANTSFRWLVYDVNKGFWSTISDWKKNEWVIWKPTKGNYWLRAEAKTSDGIESNYTIAYNPTRDYSGNYVELQGIYAQEESNGIHAGAVHVTNDPNVVYRWQVYDISKGTWKVISDWKKNEWVTWKPVKGNYWLKVEAKTSDGVESNYTIAYNIEKNYSKYYVNIEGIYAEEGNNGVRAGAVHIKNDANTSFRWLVYDINKGTWSTISDWKKNEWVTWKPAKGNYWLRVEAKTGDGIENDYTIAYNPVRDYSHNYVELQGIYMQENADGIRAGAVHVTNDIGVMYRWMVYNLDEGIWSTISDWKASEWVTWKPKAGNYWLRVEAKTSDGLESNYTIAYQMAKFEIMGTSRTTAAKMAKFYKDRYTYPAFYADSEAPTIEDFCQIYIEECAAEGVKAEVAFCQSMLETGFLQYPRESCVVSPSQYNFAGLDTTGKILPDGSIDVGRSYSGVREGIRAHVQRLKAWAVKGMTPEKYVYPCIDRDKFGSNWWRNTIIGSAPYVEWLGKYENPGEYGWATALNYGYIVRNNYIDKLLAM